MSCGGKLVERSREVLHEELTQRQFLLKQTQQWLRDDPTLGVALSVPLAREASRVRSLETALAALEATAPVAPPVQAAPPVEVAPPVEAVPVVEGAPAAQGVAAPESPAEGPRPQAEPPAAAPTASEPQPQPERPELAAAAEILEGLTSLADAPVPTPSPDAAQIEQASTWNRFWKPFLVDNGIWFAGAFCVIAGSLYIAAQAWAFAGDTARPLLVLGLLLGYATGFSLAAGFLDERRKLQLAGGILGTIGAALGAVALLALDPLRTQRFGLYVGAAAGGLAAATWLVKRAADRWGASAPWGHAAAAGVLFGLELLAPAVPAEAGWVIAAACAAGLGATWLLRRSDPPMAPESELALGLSLLGWSLVPVLRAQVAADALLSLDLTSPVLAAAGWALLRLDRLRRAEDERQRTGLAGLGLATVATGVFVSLAAAPASASAACLAAAGGLATAALTFESSALVAAAAAAALGFLATAWHLLTPELAQSLWSLRRSWLGLPDGGRLPIEDAACMWGVPLTLVAGFALWCERRGRRWASVPIALIAAAAAAVGATLVQGSASPRGPFLAMGLWLAAALYALWLTESAVVPALVGWLGLLLGLKASVAQGLGFTGEWAAFFGDGVLLFGLSMVRPAPQRRALALAAVVLAVGSGLTWPAHHLPAWMLAASGLLLFVLSLPLASRVPAVLGGVPLAIGLALTLWEVLPGPWGDALGLGLGIGCVLLAGFEARAPAEKDEGVARLQGLLGDGLALVGLLLGAFAWLRDSHPSPWLSLAAASIPWLLARRYAASWLVLPGVALLAVAAHAWSGLQVLPVLLAAGAALLLDVPGLAERALRAKPSHAAWPLGLAAAVLPLSILSLAEGQLWQAWGPALGYLLLLRWAPLGGFWLIPATVCAVAAQGRGALADPAGLAGLTLALAALGRFSDKWPDTIAWALKVHGKPLAGMAAVLMNLLALGAIGVSLDHPPHAEGAGWLLAASYALLARQLGHPLWLTLGLLLGASGEVLSHPGDELGRLAMVSLAAGLLANALRALPRAERDATGLTPPGLGAAAVGWAAWATSWAMLLEIPFRHGSWAATDGLTALCMALSARALGWAWMWTPALGLAALATGDGLDSPWAVLAWAGAASALAVAARRWPERLAFALLAQPERARGAALNLNLRLVSFLLSGAVGIYALFDHRPALLLGVAVLQAATLLASPSRLYAVAATAWAAAAAGSAWTPEAFFATLHLALGLGWLLRRRGPWKALEAAVRACSDRGEGLHQRQRSFARSLTWVPTAVAGVVLGMWARELFRWLDAGHAPDLHQPHLLGTLTLLGHLLWRRRDPLVLWAAGLAPLLAVVVASPQPLWAQWLSLTSVAMGGLGAALLSRRGRRVLTRVGLGLSGVRADRVAHGIMAVIGAQLALALASVVTGVESLGDQRLMLSVALATLAYAPMAFRSATAQGLLLLGLPVTGHLLVAFWGAQQHGGQGPAVLLVLCALGMAVLALGAERLQSRRQQEGLTLHASYAYAVVAAAEWIGALALVPHLEPREVLLAGGAMALLGVFFMLRAVKTQRDIEAYLAEASIIGLYLLARLETHVFGTDEQSAALAAVGLGLVMLGVRALAVQLNVEIFTRTAQRVSHLVPLVSLIYLPDLEHAQQATVGLALAVHYAMLGVGTRGKVASLLSGAALNGALIAFWLQRQVTDPQFYAIPFGVTLLVFARMFRAELSVQVRSTLRTVGLLAIYLASASSALYFAEPGKVMLCAAICVGGVLLGVMLRVKAYVLLGSAFLVVDVLGNMVRFGLQSPVLGGVFLTLVGLALVGGWVAFQAQRDTVLKRYQSMQDLLAGWE